MTEIISYYFLGAIVSTFLVYLWFQFSISLKFLHFLKIVEKDTSDPEDIQNELIAKYKTIGELLCCPFCLSFWVTAFVAMFFVYIKDFNLAFAWASLFSWPILIMLIFKNISNDS